MCRWLENCVLDSSSAWLRNVRMRNDLWAFPLGAWGNDSFRYFVCSALLFTFSVQFWRDERLKSATREFIWLTFVFRRHSLTCTHSLPHSQCPTPHGTLLIVLVAPAISCQINFNLIKFFHFAQSQKINENFCQINVKKLTHCKAFEGCALLLLTPSVEKSAKTNHSCRNIYKHLFCTPDVRNCVCGCWLRVCEFLTPGTGAIFRRKPIATTPKSSRNFGLSHLPLE